MRVWVVGDIHGCLKTFQALINRMNLQSSDKVICVGDLINRGEDSIGVLELFYKDPRFFSLLGNHDWAFVLSALAHTGPAHEDFRELIAHPDSGSWIAWLRKQPFAITLDKYFLVHAGCWPNWSIREHQMRADRLQTWFQQCSADELKLLDCYLPQQTTPPEGSFEENPIHTYAFDINVLTKIRYISRTAPYSIALSAKGHPNTVTEFQPWYAATPKNDKTIVFGHWSALQGISQEGIEGIDTGCAWGESLTAIELFSQNRITQRSLERNARQFD